MSTTTLIIARHGNTFTADQTPTRVGARTDLPLVEKGRVQGQALGLALAEAGLKPDRVYASRLQRTQQTAQEALSAMGIKRKIEILSMLDEIDYGPDENKPEDQVIARLGREALQEWDTRAVVPQGWRVDPAALRQDWLDFGAQVQNTGQVILVVTSNGTARFAPCLTGAEALFARNHDLKLSTGAYGVLHHERRDQSAPWQAVSWNMRPSL